MRIDGVVNVCTCNHGVAATGTGCPTFGAAQCASCRPGYTLNGAKTMCISTYIGLLLSAYASELVDPIVSTQPTAAHARMAWRKLN